MGRYALTASTFVPQEGKKTKKTAMLINGIEYMFVCINKDKFFGDEIKWVGDGKFKVANAKERLQEFRKQVLASAGFKDRGQAQAKPEQHDGVQGGSGGQMAAIANMIEGGDFEAARDYAEAVGIARLFVSRTPKNRDVLFAEQDGKLREVISVSAEQKAQWERFMRDGTLPPAPWMPSKEWQFQDIGASSSVPDSVKRSATLTRVADGSTYVATVKGYLDG